MFCINCGANQIEDCASYCSHCGKPLNQTNDTTTNKMNRFHYLVPLSSLIVIMVILFSINQHEKKINALVLDLQNKAEKAALSGDYNQALTNIETALSYRNNYKILQKEKDIILSINQINEDLNSVKKMIMNEHFDGAQKEINLLKRQIDINRSSLDVNLIHHIERAEVSVKVGEIKEEMNKIKTIDELATKLSTLYTLELQEESELKQQIYTKMVMISSSEAERHLENKHFNQAVSAVDEALQYVVNNEKLLSLKDRIIAEKTAFEKAELARIEEARIAAKVEEERNLTKAVQLTDLTLKVDKYGDAYIKGKVKNSGTETVHSISIVFKIMDSSGKVIEENKTNVFPNKLFPNEIGSFEHVTYEAKEKAKVEVKNISWVLDEKKG